MVKWCPWVPSMQGVSRRTVCANFCLVNPPAKKGKQHSKLLDISFLPRCSSSSRSFSVKHRTSRTRCSCPPDAQLGKVVKLKQLAFEACRRYALLCSTPTAVARGNLFLQGSSSKTSLEIDPGSLILKKIHSSPLCFASLSINRIF